jgi:hypothetical protein
MAGKQNNLEIKMEEAKYVGLCQLKIKIWPAHPLKACVTVEV